MTIVLESKRVALVLGLVAGLTCAVWAQPAEASSTTAKKVVPLHAVQPPSVGPAKPSANRPPQKPIGKGTGRPSLQKGHRKGQASDRGSGNRGRTKVSEKGGPAGGVDKVSRSLAYHGILEQPKRYDPSRELRLRKGAALNPEAYDLQLDHFQELDRNRDGVLDPLERAVGRLDIERDMNNH